MLSKVNKIPKKFFTISNQIVLIAILARFLSPITADLSFLILAGYALLGKKEIIRALMLLWLFNMVNSTIAPDAEFKNIARYVVIFSAFISIMLRINLKKIDRSVLYTVGLSIFLIIHSIIFSPIPDVSILKAVNWALVITTLLITWSQLSILEYQNMKRWIYNFLKIVALISLPFWFFPKIGMARTGEGFQGILSHPMVFGPAMAILASFVLGYLFEQKRRPSWSIFIFLFLSFLIVLSSESRTAGIALILAPVLSLIFVFILSKKRILSFFPVLYSKRFLSIISLLILIISIDFHQSKGWEYFISKSNQAEARNLLDAYKESRSRLFDAMVTNIIEHPFSGIGFGIASDSLSMNIKRDPILNLPISGPVEKGVTPVMVLEEVGIPGFILFLLWALFMMYRALANGASALIILSTIFLLNMAEATLFSLGGAGLLNLILLTLVVTKVRLLKIHSNRDVKV